MRNVASSPIPLRTGSATTAAHHHHSFGWRAGIHAMSRPQVISSLFRLSISFLPRNEPCGVHVEVRVDSHNGETGIPLLTLAGPWPFTFVFCSLVETGAARLRAG